MRTRTILRTALLLSLAVVAGTLLPRAEEAAALSLTINTTSDAVDALPGDGVCATNTGACSLRAAVQEANAVPGPDAITIPAGTFTLSVPGANEEFAATGDLDVRDDIRITGSGMTSTVIDAAGLDRAFDVKPSLTLSMSSLTVRHGNAGASLGGGILLVSGEPAVLTNVRIANNAAASGAGLFNSGSATVIADSILEDNVAQSSGGGIENAVSAVITVTRVAVRRNTAFYHGGGVSSGGELHILNSVVTDNEAYYGSSGVYVPVGAAEILGSAFTENDGYAVMITGGTAHIADTTLSNNGTAIQNTGQGRTVLENATIHGNASEGITSAGEPLLGVIPMLTVRNSSIVRNGAGISGGSETTTIVSNTLISDNEFFDTFSGQAVPQSCTGEITSAGHNLEDLDRCGFDQPGDLVNADALIGVLQDNGGPVLTVGLLPGSSALDAGDDATCTNVDARGVGRPFNGDGDAVAHCDIGAYEFIPGPDTDNDGCDDLIELGPNQVLGGLRDPNNFWDFFDVPVGAPPARDRVVSGGDIAAVVARFGAFGDPGGDPLAPAPPAPAYHTAFERGGMTPGSDLWDLLPPNGSISSADIGAVVAQFGHSCA
jgi:hypothetical protein